MKVITIMVIIMTWADGQNHRLKKKVILIRTRDWSGLYGFEEYKHYRKTIKTMAGRKKIKKQWDI